MDFVGSSMAVGAEAIVAVDVSYGGVRIVLQ